MMLKIIIITADLIAGTGRIRPHGAVRVIRSGRIDVVVIRLLRLLRLLLSIFKVEIVQIIGTSACAVIRRT